MRSFDIYLKKRLTEIDVIITQLSQRDLLLIDNYFYLLCSYDAVLQKKMRAESQMLLNANLENFLALVHEKVNSEMYLKFNAELLNRVFTTGDTEMILSVDETGILEKSFFNGDSTLDISVSPLDYYITYLFGDVEFGMKLCADGLDVLKYSLEKFENEFEIFANIKLLNKNLVGIDDVSLTLDVNPTNILYKLFIATEPNILFLDSNVSGYGIKKYCIM